MLSIIPSFVILIKPLFWTVASAMEGNLVLLLLEVLGVFLRQVTWFRRVWSQAPLSVYGNFSPMLGLDKNFVDYPTSAKFWLFTQFWQNVGCLPNSGKFLVDYPTLANFD